MLHYIRLDWSELLIPGEFVSNVHTFSRRTFAGVTALAAGGLVPARLMAQTPVASPVSGEGWALEDARGVTVSLPQQPVRVVAQTFLAQSLYDYGYEVVGHFGVDDAAGGFQATGDLDLDSIPFLGVSGEYDLEKLIGLEPDLIVEFSWLADGEAPFWFLDPDSAKRFEEIAPIFSISMAGTSINDNIVFVRDLAAALGADVETPEILADVTAYEEAALALTAATETNPGIKVLALQNDPQMVYMANPDWHADLVYYKSLGVTFTPFEVDDDPAPFWGSYSAELLGTFPTDLYLTIVDLSIFPIWETLPAVEAGQVGEWKFSTRVSHRGFTANLLELADLIGNAEVVSE